MGNCACRRICSPAGDTRLDWRSRPHTGRHLENRQTLATPQVQFVLASANPDFVNSAATATAKAAALDVGNDKTVAAYRANLEGLKASTHYLYRVGDGNNWGEWNGFHTASEEPKKFRFI